MVGQSSVSILISRLPDEIVLKLQEIAERWNSDCWYIGEVTNKICDYVREGTIEGVGIMDVYDTVSALLKRVVSARTVRYYATATAFYPEGIQKMYPGLPFSHFVLAMEYRPNSDRVLSLSAEYMDKYNRPPSESWLRSNLGGVTQAEENLPQLEAEVELDVTSFLPVDPEIPDHVNGDQIELYRNMKNVQWFVSNLDRLIKYIEKGLEHLPVSDDARQHMIMALRELQNALDELYLEVEHSPL